MKQIKKDNFKRITENRVPRIVAMINQLSHLSNSSFYDYSDEDIEIIFDTINAESAKTKEYLLSQKKKKSKFTL